MFRPIVPLYCSALAHSAQAERDNESSFLPRGQGSSPVPSFPKPSLSAADPPPLGRPPVSFERRGPGATRSGECGARDAPYVKARLPLAARRPLSAPPRFL
ncbi:hypothetical protein EVAR_25340_1 [Eumeta japonica]|uniref:Uncharacterized protein n=1 Tax=Eumeta variegata TaxID=151549 RepID=A0A4C1XZ16_EUMVA|nr:hypothetical protein EVAR_25340_1 [Eumeta japonica]